MGKGGSKKFAKKKRPVKKKVIKKPAIPNIENTGMEALYLKDLMVAEELVVVVLRSGEEILGFVRYYDKDVVSIGPADDSPKMLLPKDSIRYIYEAEDALAKAGDEEDDE